jgi:shikimate kinase
MMGSGKSAVGRALAQRLGVPLHDSDAAIEVAANATIAEIFARDGEAFFRDREHEVINRLLSGPPAILSTGGGAYLAERNRTSIGKKGIAVWLDADLATLWERVRHKETRPLLKTADPYGTLKSLYEARIDTYRLAEVRVESRLSYSIDQTTDRVIAALRWHGDTLGEAT